MFLIPYGTNAPIYHWPIATVGLIVINVVVFALSIASPESVEPFILAFGDGFHPVQWITSNFLHADIFHLIGNMLFLWAFGIIVEGKLGVAKMLAGVETGTQLVLWGGCLWPTFGTHRMPQAESFGLHFLPSLVSIGSIPCNAHANTFRFFLRHGFVH